MEYSDWRADAKEYEVINNSKNNSQSSQTYNDQGSITYSPAGKK